MKMRAFLSFTVAGVAAGFALAGCPALDALSGDLILNKDYFPLVDNAEWIYEVTKDGSAVGTASMKLTGVKTEAEGLTGEGTFGFTIPVEGGTPISFSTEIRKTAAAVQLAGQAELLKIPVKVGDTWSANATSDVLAVASAQDPTIVVVGTQRVEFTIGGEKVSSPSVRVDMKAFNLTEEGEPDTSKLKSPMLRRWFVAGIGMVRQTSTLPPLAGYTLTLIETKGL